MNEKFARAIFLVKDQRISFKIENPSTVYKILFRGNEHYGRFLTVHKNSPYDLSMLNYSGNYKFI